MDGELVGSAVVINNDTDGANEGSKVSPEGEKHGVEVISVDTLKIVGVIDDLGVEDVVGRSVTCVKEGIGVNVG